MAVVKMSNECDNVQKASKINHDSNNYNKLKKENRATQFLNR